MQGRMTDTNAPSPSRTVLVIDDDADSCEIVCALLEGDECRTIAFAEGRDAVLYAMHNPVDVAIVDLHLGSMGGTAVARALRALGCAKKVALVALSGTIDPHWEIVRHFDAYLRKPVDATMLPALVVSLAAAARCRTSDESGSSLDPHN
jgi:CheY-like chemotaxis protein